MSYVVTAYSINFDELHRLRGSRDKAFLARLEHAVIEATPVVLPRLDLPLDVPPPGPLDVREAVRRVVFNGAWTAEQDDIVRTSVMLFLTECYGSSFSPLPFNKVEAGLAEADAALEAFGTADANLCTQLFTGGLPPELHYARFESGYRSSGHLPRPVVARLHERLAGAKWPHLRGKIANLLDIVGEIAALAAADGSGMLGVVGGSDTKSRLMFYTMRFDLVGTLPGSGSEVAMARYDRWSAYDGDAFTPRLDLDDAAFLAWNRKQQARGNPKESVVGAARDILEATPRFTRYPGTYHGALETICQLTGVALPNESLAPAAPQHLTAVDETLSAEGLSEHISLYRLTFGGPPLELPRSDGVPSAGYMAPDAVRAARGMLASHDWSGADPDVQRTIAQLDQWITYAAERGEGLVAFYS